jgi:hypothetical protein
MAKFWSTESSIEPRVVGEHEDCIANAHGLYDFYNDSLKSFPLFWELIDFDRDKLATIFAFFCETLSIQMSSDTVSVVTLLGNRLTARWTGDAVTVSAEMAGKIEFLSQELMNAFCALEKQQLLGPAFELFAAGALSLKRPQFMTAPPSETLAEVATVATDPEPDSGGYFYWAEFALLAAELGFQAEQWKGVLPVLLRSERIFALCYGESQGGVIPPTRMFQDYTFGGFTMLHPDVAKVIPLSTAATLAGLEAEATDAASFAFPGEFAADA